MNVEYPSIHPLSERALLVIMADTWSRETSARVLAFDRKIAALENSLIEETIPALRSVMVVFDASRCSPTEIESLCRDVLTGVMESPVAVCEGRHLLIPAIYGGEHGPDIRDAARLAGIDERSFIDRHSSCQQEVACLGFAPGLAYLMGLPAEFDIARNRTAGRQVPAGSILVANRQTVFTSTGIPTGWKRVATSPIKGFDPEGSRPFLLNPGDRVSFAPISADHAERWSGVDNWSRLEVVRT